MPPPSESILSARAPHLLLLLALIAAILPPGYAAYIGAYVALIVALLIFLLYGWRERSTFRHPTSMAITGAIVLVATTVPFVYQSQQDLLAPVLLLPMLATVALGMLARPAISIPSAATFSIICLSAAGLALAGGIYEHFVLGSYRSGLGNNPIHYGTLATMAGCLAIVGVTSGASRWRYLFLLGPVFGVASAMISGSRGPMMGALVMVAVSVAVLSVWLWRDRLFRIAISTGFVVGTPIIIGLLNTRNMRVASLFSSALDVFRFTGGSDDIRAALYYSAVHILQESPVFGVGLGQIMITAENMFPEIVIKADLENLHADWANFAAMAGGLGLFAYLLLLAAPLLLLRSARARQDRPLVLGALLLSMGQLTFGISNATFGILPQTVIYAVVLGYFLACVVRIEQNQQ